MERALRIFGEHATLLNLQAYTEHTEAIEQAVDLFPNAVLLWGALNSREQQGEPPDPYTIASNAHAKFYRDCALRGIGAVNMKDAPGDDPPNSRTVKYRITIRLDHTNADHLKANFHPETPQEQQKTIALLCKIFLNLPTEALRRTGISHSNRYQYNVNHIFLCRSALAAGHIPSHQAALILLQNPYILTSAPPALVSAFIRRHSATDDSHTLRKATEELRLVHAMAQEGKREHKKTDRTTNLLRLLTESDNKPAPTWQGLVDASNLDTQELRTPKGKKRAAPKPKGKPPTSTDSETFIRTPHGDDICLMANEEPTWTEEPGRRLTVFTDDPSATIFIIEKTGQGAINIISGTPFVNHPILPTPQQPGKRWPHPANRNNLRRFLGIEDHEVMARTAIEHLASNWQRIRPHPDLNRPTIEQLSWAIQSYIVQINDTPKPQTPSCHRDTYSQDPTGVTAAVNKALREMAEPQVLETVTQHVNPASTHHYNAFITLGNNIEELCRTNPGAVSWAMNHAPSTEPINHPGQLITLARTSLTEAGMEPGNWKFITRLQHPIIKNTHHGHADRLVTLLNAMAKSDAVLTPDTAEMLMETVINSAHKKTVQHRKGQEAPNLLIMTNLTAMLALLCQEDSIKAPGHPEAQSTMDEAMDVTDYVIDLTDKLGFAHFKRRRRGNLQAGGTGRPGVPAYRGWLRTVKNLLTPATGGVAPGRWHRRRWATACRTRPPCVGS